ncbi:MAG: DUF1326 domain-containing protein [Methylomonas lenta]|nr:DUF1326 domain-containing protein [Methylomonas lenta]
MNTSLPDWRLQGRYFETCNCEVSCPRIWLQPPTEGECKLLVAWHIDNGHLEDTRMDGLNVALACHAPGNRIKGGWSAALYLDANANSQQIEALIRIFTGMVGGHLSDLLGFVGKVWGIKQVVMNYSEADDSRHLSIPGIAEAEIQSISGIRGGEAQIENPPLCVVTSHPAIVAKSKQFSYNDYGQNWAFSERNGYHSEFVYHP